MTALALRTRRMLLSDMGRAGLAVMILGTAACSSDSTDNTTPTPDPSDTTPGDGTSTRPEAASSTGAPGTSPSAGPPGAGFEWQRVNLGFVSAYILYRAGEAVVVDTGVSDSEEDIETGLSIVGLGWDAVGGVILTHKHPDHQGSLQAVLALSEAPWYAGSGDIPAITAPREGKAVGDGDQVFDLGIIETPGHTPGHISILDPDAGILLAGDAINGEGGGVAGPNPQFSEDIDLANASVTKLAGFDYEVILFGHGEPVMGEGSSLVADLAG